MPHCSKHLRRVERSECTKTRLAESAVAAVDVCGCGTIQLHIGAFTVRLAGAALSELLGTLGAAVAAHSALLLCGTDGEIVPSARRQRESDA